MAKTAASLALLLIACASAELEHDLEAPDGHVNATAGHAVPDAEPSADSDTTPAPGGEVGTPHPLVIEAVSSTGTWVAYCQAREDTDRSGTVEVGVGYHGDMHGDRLDPFLDIGGRELAIDAFVAGSSDGRWVAVARDEALELHDVASGKVQHLEADAADDPNPSGGHRAASFDDAAKRVLYLGKFARKKGSPIVVRELDSGKERRVIMPGKIWRAWFDDDGKHVWAWVVTRDTDGDKRLTLPLENTTLSGRRCRGPVSISGSYGWSGDRPELMLATLADGGSLTAAPGALGVIGDTIIARNDDGSLEARSPKGTTVIAKAECGANVLFADPSKGRVAFVCRAKEKVDGGSSVWAPLFFFEKGKVVDSGEEMRPTFEDDFGARRRIGRTRGKKWYDLAKGEFVKEEAQTKDTPIGGDETRMLYAPRKGKPYVRDETSGKRTPIDVRLAIEHDAYWPQGRVAGSMLAVPTDDDRDVVIDLAKAKVQGVVPGHALALTSAGLVLLGKANESGVLVGPLRWHAPAAE